MSPEEILLLKLAVPQSDAKGLSFFIQTPSVDWERLFSLAERHKMAGLIASGLLGASDGFMPEKIRTEWTSRWQFLAMRDLAQMAALREILTAAKTQNLYPLLLKGWAVHLQAYSQDAARGASDIDLLIQPAQAPSFVQCLESLGFVFKGTDSRGRSISDWSALLKRTNEATFHRSSDKVSIDFHWSLCAPVEELAAGLRLSEQLWKSHREISLSGCSYRIPGREEELLFLCVHLLKSSPFLLRNLSDIIRLVRVLPAVDWDRLLSLSESTGTGAMAYYAFELVSAVEPDLVPPFVQTGLARFSGPRWLFSPFLRLDLLLETRGEKLTNLALRWRGAFFARNLWLWIPYQAVLHGKGFLRKFGLC